jgi:hypothetical protein
VSERLVSIFKKQGAHSARGKYLARLFGIFSEEVVRIWAADDRCVFKGCGRPTLKLQGKNRGATLDFTLEHRHTGLRYVAELKCEIEFQNYRYFELSDVSQLDHHRKDAFRALLNAAKEPSTQEVCVGGKRVEIHGAILIWGAATSEGRRAVKDEKHFFDVLTVADMLRDLCVWENQAYKALLAERRQWTNELFDGLASLTD